MSKTPAAPTLEGVARRAGVSRASAPRVLNGVAPTSAALRAAVQKAVEDLGYVPRRARPSGARPILAVLTPDLPNPCFNEVIRSIEERALAAGLVTSLMEVPPGLNAAEAAAEWVRAGRPTAAIGSCDLMAPGVLHAVRSAQPAVPRDISGVGFDDIAMACHANPPLTTISPPRPGMGRLAVDLILRGAESRASSVSSFIMLESPLVVWESTGRVGGAS